VRVESLLKDDILGMKVSYCLSYLTSNRDSVIHRYRFLLDVNVLIKRITLLHGGYDAWNGFENSSHEQLQVFVPKTTQSCNFLPEKIEVTLVLDLRKSVDQHLSMPSTPKNVAKKYIK
jgi:hypothetical protein